MSVNGFRPDNRFFDTSFATLDIERKFAKRELAIDLKIIFYFYRTDNQNCHCRLLLSDVYIVCVITLYVFRHIGAQQTFIFTCGLDCCDNCNVK